MSDPSTCPNCGAKAEPPSALGPNVLTYECGSIGILGQPLRRVSTLCDALARLMLATAERDQARREAEGLRDDLRVHITEGPCLFSWEPDETPPATGGEV